jgi:hypothetical protein
MVLKNRDLMIYTFLHEGPAHPSDEFSADVRFDLCGEIDHEKFQQEPRQLFRVGHVEVIV